MTWPEGWREVALDHLAESVQAGFGQRPDQEDDGSTPQIGTHNVTPGGRISLAGIKHVTVEVGLERYRLLPGDVVFNNTNSEEWVGKTALFELEGEYVYSNHMTRIRAHTSLVEPAFLAAYLHFLWSTGYVRGRARHSVSQATIDLRTLQNFKVLLPRLREQRRIIECLRAVGVERFQDAVARARELRQALVHATVARRLTAAWRVADPATPQAADASERDHDGWRRVPLGDLVEAQPGFAQPPDAEGAGTTPQIRTHNVTPEGLLSLEGIKYVTIEDGELDRYQLLPGDVIFNNTNNDEQVGRTALFALNEGKYVYSNHMTRIRVRSSLVAPAYLAAYIHVLWSSGYARHRAKRRSSQAIDEQTLLKFSVPLPPLPEQHRIAEILDQADLAPFHAAAARAQELYRALAAEAFAGRLTAGWRSRQPAELAAAVPRNVEAPEQQPPAPAEHPASRRSRRQGLTSQLSPFQRDVWGSLHKVPRIAVPVDDPAAFAGFCDDAMAMAGLQGTPAEVRRTLEQLAAMGLICKMSLPRADPNTGRVEFLTAFRPLHEDKERGRVAEDVAEQDAGRVQQELARRRQEAR